MASPWDGFARTILGEFESGYAMGRERKNRREDRDRQSAYRAEDQMLAERRQMAADEERQYGRRKDVGFEGSADPAESAFRERMKRKEDLAARETEADIAYKGRMPQDRLDPAARGEQAVGAKITALGAGIADIDERGREAGSRWYLPSFMEKEELSADDARLREQLKARRLGLLGVGGSPAPAADRKALYLKARREGKSEAEARRIAQAGG